MTVLGARTSYAVTEDSTITPDQFKAWTEWMKKSVDVLNRRQSKLEAQEAELSKRTANSSSSSGGDSVDLGASLTPPQEAAGSKGPKLTSYFDLNFINQPGTIDSLAFDNYHTFLFFDIAPTPDLTFSFNLLGPQTFPIFYELDYQVNKRLTLRAGKIWIPFDDLSSQSPHNIFGGRVGLQQLEPTTSSNGGNLFLPSVWTELGVGAKYLLVDSSRFQVETHLCLVNGFTDGGTDPVTGSHDYPNFSEYTPATQQSSGNHRAKAIAARVHAMYNNRFGIGVSYYTGQWNEDSDPAGHLGLSMLGFDAQAHILFLDLRAGIASMNVSLPGTSTQRGGSYFEAGYPFATRWKALARVGTLQLDSRIALPTDELIAGGTLLYNPGIVQFSIEHSRDISNPGVSVGFTSYTDLRMIVMF